MKKRIISFILLLAMFLNIASPYSVLANENEFIEISISIDKDTINKGFVFKKITKSILLGSSVWDITKEILDENDIDCEYSYSEKYKSVYVESIDGDGEFDHGSESGWMYNVNGEYPNFGASEYILKNGDKIEWRYTKDLGRDLGHSLGKEEIDFKKINILIDRFYNLEKKNYEESSIRELEKIVKISKEKIETNITKDELDKLENKLEDALDSLKLVNFDEDKVELNKLIDKFYSLDKSLYEKDKYKEIFEYIEYVEDILKKETIGEDLKKYIKEIEKKLSRLEKFKMDYKIALEKNLEYLYSTNDNPIVGSIGGEWNIIALSRSDKVVSKKYYNEYYSNVRSFISKNIKDGKLHRSKSTENSRLILGLTSIGIDPRDIDGNNLLEGLRDLNYLKKQGINGPIWALIALDSHDFDIPKAKNNEQKVTREILIEEILKSRLNDGGWAISKESINSEVDITAMAIQALSRYKKDSYVSKAIEEALNYLSKEQYSNGGFKLSGFGDSSEFNLESTAQVLVALSGLNIDANMDKRFIKDNNSLIDFMMNFYSEDGGFKHLLNGKVDAMATEQGTYALVSYNRFLENENFIYDMNDLKLKSLQTDIYEIVTDLKDGKQSKNDIKFNAKGFKNGKLIDVKVRHDNKIISGNSYEYKLNLKKGKNLIILEIVENGLVVKKKVIDIELDDENFIDELEVTISIDKKTINKGFVVKPIKIKIEKGSNVWDLTKKLLDKEKIDYDYVYTKKYNSVYVESIDGDGEFDHGPDSGWMYNVNGKYPNYGASQYKLKDRDKIEWRYTKDLGHDLGQDLSQWEEVDNKDINELKKLKRDAQKILDKKSLYTEKSIKKLEEALDLKEKTSVDIKDKIKSIKEAIKDIEKTKDINVLKKELDRLIKEFNDLDKDKYLEEDILNIENIIKLNDDSFEKLENKIMKFSEALDNLKILKKDEIKEFVDIEDISKWAIESVKEANKIGIINGNKKGEFRPREVVTRAEFIKMILIGLEKNIDDNIENNFIDVYPKDWYYKYVNTGYEMGIIKGSNYKYNPKDGITREEIASIISRIATIELKNIEKPKDYNEISNWAKKDVLKVISENLIVGNNDKFYPKNETTREMAVVIIMRLRKNI